jgi:hypothetical protein
MTPGTPQPDLQAVWSAWWSGCYRLLAHEAPRAWRGPLQASYRVEREHILTHLQPFGMGLFVTAFCFTTFRVSGSHWWSRLRTTYFRTSALGPASAATATASSRSAWEGHLSKQTQDKQSEIGELLQLPLDLLLSVILGSLAYLVLYDSDKVQQDVVQLPLLPGRSLVHAAVCPPVVEALKNHALQSSGDDEDGTREFFLSLADNCLRRSRYLSQREQLGLSPLDLVPYPGLKGGPAKGNSLQWLRE